MRGGGYAFREVPPPKERAMIPEGRQSFDLMSPTQSRIAPLQDEVNRAIDDLLASFPDPDRLSFDERRGIIARYTAVLEGNFIYWMTAAYLACVSAEAHAIIHENLLEEVRDNHPGMLRRFATAAHAVPTDSDALAVYRNLQSVRLFVGRLSGVRIVLTMAFFEGWFTRFMPYLPELAKRKASAGTEYTDVTADCEDVHAQEVFGRVEG